jgi:type IV secretory pathway VirB10-like protein
MELNKLVFGGLAIGCMAAAAGGGYLAARQSAAPAPSAVVAPVTAPTTPEADGASQPVSESEGIIAPEPAPAPPAAKPAEPPAVAPRRESAPPPSRVTAAPAARAEAPRRAPNVSDERRARAEAPANPNTTSNAPAAAPGGMWEARPAVTPQPAPAFEPEPEAPPAPPEPEFVDLVIPSDAVLGLQIERTISSETARVEDRVDARVARDVRVGDRVAIPAGSVVQGSVMEVERGGKVRERARLGIRFHTVVLGNGTRLAIRTDSVIREGVSPAKESAAKIGGAAVGGAILGAILGGGKGAIIGGATGASGGTAATMAGDRNPALLPAGTTVSVRMQQPVTVTVEK